MSLSLATAAERGRYGTVCCDGRLVFGKVAADVFAPKFQWLGEWVFMIAGKMASADLVIEELRIATVKPEVGQLFTREQIADTLVWAFNRRLERWKWIRHLSGSGMTMQEFVRHGRVQLGAKLHEDLFLAMKRDAKLNFDDQVMVVGWGAAASSLTIHSVSLSGDKSHMKDGHGAIGSGSEQAIETLVKLQHGASASLQDAIYATLAAKFSAEGKLVGKDTTMFVLRNPHDQIDGPTRINVGLDKVEAFRKIWSANRRMSTIPEKAQELAATIVEETRDDKLIQDNAAQRAIAGMRRDFKQFKQSTSRRRAGSQ